MTERERFAVLSQTGRFTEGELCRDFGISRKTGHKYLKRYRCDGREGLADRSRRPKKSPTATAKSVEALILKERVKHPTWGPKKIRDLLIKVHKVEQPPHVSTIALTLSRHGLSQKRKTGAYRVRPEHLTEPTRPNQVWKRERERVRPECFNKSIRLEGAESADWGRSLRGCCSDRAYFGAPAPVGESSPRRSLQTR